jgi:thiol:disulfide interchange protein DsbD
MVTMREVSHCIFMEILLRDGMGGTAQITYHLGGRFPAAVGILRAMLGALLLILACLWGAGVSAAVDTAAPKVTAALVGEVVAVRSGEPFWVALHQRITPGWHTYWRNPGDSGEAVVLDWALPPGFVADDIAWPVPERLPTGPMMSFGFTGEVLLPVRITPPAELVPGQRIDLRAHASWLVCAAECIPEEGTVALSLTTAGAGPAPADPRWGPRIVAARAALPRPSPWAASFSATADTVTLNIAAAGLPDGRITEVAFFPYAWGPIAHAGAQRVELRESSLVLRMPRGPLADAVTRPIEGVLVVTERLDTGPSRQALVVRAEPVAAPTTLAWPVLLGALGLALVGGLVLNLMPCVLPVLSVKVLALVAHAEATPAARRRHGLVYTAGVLLAFGVVGGALVALRAGGEQIGWGFHLQSPVFVALLAYVLFATALAMSGAVVIGGGLGALGSGLAARAGLRGSFVAGVLATVVATPCTAPFMATALGYAITQPPLVALAVFEALGLGLALPFLALSFAPGWLRRMPGPGRWMQRLEQLLAFPLYATVAWLVWVLSQQTGAVGLGACLAGLVLIALGAWLHETTRHATGAGRVLARAATLATVLLAVALPLAAPTPAARPAAAGTAGEPFTPARLAELRARGVPVFVNVTAAWCVTCLVNERVVLRSPAVAASFARNGVVHLTADWTRRDPEITRMLAAFERSGVPLYLLYPRSGRDAATLLPQLLTERMLLESLERL